MRGLAITALVVLMGLGALFILGPREAAESRPASEVAAQRAEPARFAASTSRGAAASERSDRGPTFYQYTDEQGRIHFVQSAGDVPARYRKTADTLEVTSEIIRPDQRKALPAPRQPAFAYTPDPEPRRAQAATDVVIYTAPWCGWCQKTIAWLDARGVDYDNRDIDADPRARDELIAKTGGTSIPVVDVDGQIIRGYSPGKMKHLLQL